MAEKAKSVFAGLPNFNSNEAIESTFKVQNRDLNKVIVVVKMKPREKAMSVKINE